MSKLAYLFSDCFDPPDGENTITKHTKTTHGSNVTYLCDVGYEQSCGDVILSCDDGVWLGIPLTCTEIGRYLFSYEYRYYTPKDLDNYITV